MLTALLPGVRELRTPLATGLLWAAALWLLFGERVANSPSTQEFMARLEHLGLGSSTWLGVAVFAAYLVGSLLIVRSSPFRWIEQSYPRVWPARRVGDSAESQPSRAHAWVRSVSTLWQTRLQTGRWTRIRGIGGFVVARKPIDIWLGEEFDQLARKGTAPVTNSWEPSCETRYGFVGLFATASIQESDVGDENETLEALRDSYVCNIRREQSAVEVRIQMRFPQVYMEIDRVRTEGELRLSVFWPLLAVIALLAVQWSPWIASLVSIPTWLMLDGFQRLRDAEEKTWIPVIAGEVTTPMMDSIKRAEDNPPSDFMETFYQDVPWGRSPIPSN